MTQYQSSAVPVRTAIGQSAITQAFWISVFAVATAVGAQIELPHTPVPYTLQSLVVLLSGGILGKRNGALSQLAYLVLGVAGAPVFSGWSFGIAHLVGPTGGYLLSFPVVAFVVGYLIEGGRSYAWILMAMVTGLLLLFAFGTLQLYLMYYHDVRLAWVNGFLIFSWWDALKLIASASVVHQIQRVTTIRN